MANSVRRMVSKNKRRYELEGYNLDLSYINDRIIAMGFPSENYEAIYRNPMQDVRRFLEDKHKDRYKIYNLCSERSYNIENFHSRVAFYPFDDHHPPEFRLMGSFCHDVANWLADHPRNVAVVHCKAGKGRTGLMICAFLLHSGEYQNAQDVLDFYGSVRTSDNKGVTIASQRRYIDYYATILRDGLQYNPVKMYLTKIVISSLPHLSLGQQEGHLQFEVRQSGIQPYQSRIYEFHRSDTIICLDLEHPLLIVGDVKLEFRAKMKIPYLGGRTRYMNSGKLFHFWVNTFFLDRRHCSALTHDTICDGIPDQPAGGGAAAAAYDRQRASRSAHSSGSPVPPPRQFRQPPRFVEACSDREDEMSKANGAAAADEELHSPNGSCLASIQTVTGGPPARTVSIVDKSDEMAADQKAYERDMSNLIKHTSISDDHLLTEHCKRTHEATLTTHKSFINSRMRHTSFPQTAKSLSTTGAAVNPDQPRRSIAGRQVSVRLTKPQIDGAAKDKKFENSFSVTLFLIRPTDQILKAEFSRSNLVAQGVRHEDNWDVVGGDEVEGRNGGGQEGDEEEEEEDQDVGGMVRNKTDIGLVPSAGVVADNGGGMVRNQTEPSGSLSTAVSVSHSTWI